MGFFGSYTLGLEPSKMPPCGVARAVGEGETAAEETAAAVDERCEATEDMAVHWCERRRRRMGVGRKILYVSWTMERHGRSIRYTFVRLTAYGKRVGSRATA